MTVSQLIAHVYNKRPWSTIGARLLKTELLRNDKNRKNESFKIQLVILVFRISTGLVTSKLDVFASIDRTVSQGFWLRDHAIFTSIYLNLRVVASISRSLQSRLNKRGSVALVSQIELNKREADSQYDTHV